MIAVYVTQLSPRLNYILSFITERTGITFKPVTDKNEFESFDGCRINYSTETFPSDVQIIPVALLTESGIKPKETDLFSYEGTPAFFKTGGDFPFDIFSASFYLISRYEEYLPYKNDLYRRFPHTDSLSYKNNFIHLPVADIWLRKFENFLKENSPSLIFKKKPFSFIPTYDIDIAYSYKHKGLIRNVGGFIKKPGLDRIRVIMNKEKDPFDCYSFLHGLHERFSLKPVYFFLVASSNGIYDKNILPDHPAMHNLVKEHSRYTIGLHPSWQSNFKPELIREEKLKLQKMSGIGISRSRQHYIKLELPQTYRQLCDAGITDDYSMGYGSINGFRASTGSSYMWYDLAEEKQSGLRIHPFCFMDANSFYEQHQDAETSLTELEQYLKTSEEFCDQMITVFHNNFLGTDKKFRGWREMYEKFTSRFLQ